MKKHQVAIVGGGMVGSALALGLVRQGFDVALIENQMPNSFESTQPIDLRISAVSMATVNLLTTLGVWDKVLEMRACPYRQLETWEHPACRTQFNASEIGLDQLGYMVENRVLQLALWSDLVREQSLTLYCPESLENLVIEDEYACLTLCSGDTIDAEWVIGADGAHSKVRQLSDIGVTAWDYRQHCMLINIDTHRDQQDITWQQFFPTGPRSFLPFIGSQASLVWYDSPQKIQQLMTMTHSQIEHEIWNSFPRELGEVTVLQKGSFPLVRRHAQSYFKGRSILVGDSAHTINPLAGQGVNLGFKDVKALLDEIKKMGNLSSTAINRYYRRRVVDNFAMQAGMDFFYTTFSNDRVVFKFARNALLKAANISGPVKKEVLRYAIGLKEHDCF